MKARILSVSNFAFAGDECVWPADVRQRYRQHAADAVRQHLPELGAHGFFQNHANGSITPRGTRTEVHHDSHHHSRPLSD